MARSFRELGRQAEELIEQGNEAEDQIQACNVRVAQAQNAVAYAASRVAQASQLDENGEPQGDAHQAMVELSIAQNQLAASHRSLAAAQNRSNQVRQEKQMHVNTIEQYAQAERENLEKLQRLKGGAFGDNTAQLTQGIADRVNEAEDARIALLRSEGIDVSAEYVSAPMERASIAWDAGNFETLDLSGQAEYYRAKGHGGVDADGMVYINGVPTPVGGALAGDGVYQPEIEFLSPDPIEDDATPADFAGAAVNQPPQSAPQAVLSEQEAYFQYLSNLCAVGWDESRPAAERSAALAAARTFLECLRQRELAQQPLPQPEEEESDYVRKKNPEQLQREGAQYIDHILEVYRDNLRGHGVMDGVRMEAAISCYREAYERLLAADYANGTYHLYDHTVPDFSALAVPMKEPRDDEDVASRLRTDFGLRVVNLEGVDKKVVRDLYDALYDAKRTFPELDVSYLGTCQNQVEQMTADLTNIYRQALGKAHPNWSLALLEKRAEKKAKYDLRKFEIKDNTYAWSLTCDDAAYRNAQLGKYGGVGVNMKFAKDHHAFHMSTLADMMIKYHPEGCDKPKSILDHEMGHEIASLLQADTDPRINDLYRRTKRSFHSKELLSKYGMKTIHEFIAEGYAEYRNNPEPRACSRAVYERLVQLHREKKKGWH